VVLAVGTVALVTIALLVWRRPARAELSPGSLRTHLVISVESWPTVRQAIRGWGVPNGRLNAPLPMHKGQQYVVGHLTYVTPRTVHGDAELVVFLIDQRTHKPVTMWGVVPNAKARTANGWDGRYNEFPKKFPWLAPVADIRLPDGSFTDPATTFSMLASTSGPVTFVAPVDLTLPKVTNPGKDFLAVLGYLGTDGHVKWAERLPIASS